MSYYQNASKIIYRRYRVIRKIIQTFEYTNARSFSNGIVILINAVFYQMNAFYGCYSCLARLNIYYRGKCLEELYVRNDIESIMRCFKNDK